MASRLCNDTSGSSLNLVFENFHKTWEDLACQSAAKDLSVVKASGGRAVPIEYDLSHEEVEKR